jgi:hypothetical protein
MESEANDGTEKAELLYLLTNILEDKQRVK